MKLFLSAAAMLAFTAVPVGAQTSPAVTDSTPKTGVAPAPAPEKKVCRSEVSTGSIMPKRTCHTKSEWAQIDDANHRDADHELSRRGSTFTAQP